MQSFSFRPATLLISCSALRLMARYFFSWQRECLQPCWVIPMVHLSCSFEMYGHGIISFAKSRGLIPHHRTFNHIRVHKQGLRASSRHSFNCMVEFDESPIAGDTPILDPRFKTQVCPSHVPVRDRLSDRVLFFKSDILWVKGSWRRLGPNT